MTTDKTQQQLQDLEAERLSLMEQLQELKLSLLQTRNTSERRLQEAEILLNGFRALNDTHNTQDLFSRLIESMQGMFEYQHAFVLIREGDEDFHVVAANTTALDGGQWQAERFFDTLLSKGQPRAVFDVSMIPEWKPALAEGLDAVSGLHIPFEANQIAGIMVATHTERGYFTQDNIRLAERFIPVAAQALYNAQLNQALIQERDNLEERVEQRTREVYQSETRNRSVIDTALDAVVLADEDGIITSWNIQAEETFGWTHDEAVGRLLHELIIPEKYRDRHIKGWKRYLETGETTILGRRIELTAHNKEGDELPVEIAVSPVMLEDRIEFSAFIRDITKRKQAEQKLLIAKEEAESADRAKSEFLANMSHEIRTPMNAVIGMAGLLLDTDLSLEQRNFVSTIRSSGDALLTIINDILDFSKIEAGKLELEKQPFDLRQCVEEALDLFATQAGKQRVDLAYQIDTATPPVVVGDITRVRQIIVNLVSNALKFTKKGEVVVTVSSKDTTDKGTQLHFAVRDTGIGIPAEKIEGLFQSFSQVDASTTRKHGGTGLGLAICKQLCMMMDGEIWVESELDVGSTFHFTIWADAYDDQRYAYLETPQPQLFGQSVLVVDDNTTNRLILNRQLAKWGMDPHAVDSASAALKILKDNTFNVAILDVHMPDVDGVQLAREINILYPEVPIIFLSSSGESTLDTSNVNSVAFLQKPLKPLQLFNVLIRLSFKMQDKLINGKSKKIQETSEFEHKLAEKHPLRILIAEDNSVNQRVALQLLKRLGYRADVVANGLEAVEAVDRQIYDVVLMDVQMPEMDGVEASQLIKTRTSPAQRPRIIAVTAHAIQGDREKYLAAGMDDYISKPIRVKELTRALESTPRAGTGMMEKRDSQVFDFGVLEMQFGEDAKIMLGELIPIFMEDAEMQFEMLQKAERNKDADGVWKAAHALRSSATSVGAMKLSEAAKQVELTSRKEGLDAAAQQLQELYNCLDQVMNEARKRKA